MWELTKWRKAITTHGLRKTVADWWFYGDIKVGRLVGTDKYGNKYYQNKKEVVWGRDRWVDYAERGNPREASTIPPEWHAWMHRMTDIPPTSPNAQQYFANPPFFVWQQHRENFTGTDRAYRPYNTTKPKIESWQPESSRINQ